MSKALSVSTPADILAYVPHALGFAPVESFVFITMAGTRIGATLRVDAPAEITAGDFAGRITHYLLADAEADHVLFIVYTDETGNGEGQPFAEHAEALKAEFARAELVLVDGWLVTSKGWRNYFCDDRACCPNHSLAEITDSTLNAELVFTGSNPGTHETIADPAYRGGDGNAEKIATLADEWTSPEPFDFTNIVMSQARAAWAEAIGTTPGQDTSCTLVSYLSKKVVRDRIMADMINPDDDPDTYTAVLTGQHRGQPDWNRVDEAEALLIDLLAYTPGAYRAPLFTTLGYLAWYKGRGTTAKKYLDKALEAEAGYRLAELLRQLINNGILAAVTTSKATAYRPTTP